MEKNSRPQEVCSPVIGTFLKIGHWDKGKCHKTTDLEVEDELLAQDSPLRQHKHGKGNDREEIIGCYFHKPQIHNIFSAYNFPHALRTAISTQKPYWTKICLLKSNGIFLSCKRLGIWTALGNVGSGSLPSPFCTFSQGGTTELLNQLAGCSLGGITRGQDHSVTRSPSKAHEQLS